MAKKYEEFMTGEFRVTFPNVFEPKQFGNGKPKYSCGLIIPKTADMSAYKNAITKALTETWPDAAKRPKKLINPIKDGDTDEMEDGTLRKDKYPEIEGHYLISASSTYKPGVVDHTPKEIINPQEFYSGCYARAILTCFAYAPNPKNPQSKSGVGFGLQYVQKLRDGEPFSGRRKAEEVFAPVAQAATIGSADDIESMFS